jgi:hypothetical protein
MKRFFKIFTLHILLLFSSTLTAIISPGPNGWAFGAEYLYWHPLYEQSFYAVENTSRTISTPIGQRVHNPMKWASGFKVEGIYGLCSGNEFDVRWTHVHNRFKSNLERGQSASVAATQGQPFWVLFTANQGHDNTRFNFDAVEFLFWRMPLSTENCLVFRGGLNYTYIGFKRDLNYVNTLIAAPRYSNITQRNSYWGIGPEIALDFYYPLSSLLPSCWCPWPVSLHGDIRGSLLVSRSKASMMQNDALASTGGELVNHVDLQNDPVWRLVPVYDLCFGFSYDCAWRCLNINLELGYELLSYNRAIQTITLYGGNSGGSGEIASASFDEYANLDFHGPYIALGFSF